MAEQDTPAAEQTAPPSKIKKLMVPVALVLVAVGATIGGLKVTGMLGGAPAAEAVTADDAPVAAAAGAKPGAPAYFFSLYPDLLVNFKADGRPHYLKASVDVMARDEEAIKGVEQYHSIVRNNLLRLFQQVEFDTVNSEEGIDTMRALALEEVKKVLATYHGNSDIEGVYFTSFVVQ